MRAIVISVFMVAIMIGMSMQPLMDTLNPKTHKTGTPLDAVPMTRGDVPKPFLNLKDLAIDLIATTTNTTDTDGDGLPNNVELVLGTDWNNTDSDYDKLSDYYEVFNDMDPNDPDSNGDGLADYYEVDNVTFDLDGDGTSNAWDWDNDGDGVMDDLDLSPFARTATAGGFTLDLNFSANITYITFQIRTKDPDHLRLYMQSWDWPNDAKANMRDLDGSADDLFVNPVLELTSSGLPDAQKLAECGVSRVKDTAYLPLVPVWEYGNIVAFKGRIVFPQSTTPNNLSADLALRWKVMGRSDTQTASILTETGYLSCGPGGDLTTTSPSVGADQTFDYTSVGGGKVSLRASNGLYVAVSPNGTLSATGASTGENSVFEPVDYMGMIAFKASNGKFLNLAPDGRLVADGESAETTSLLDVDILGTRFDTLQLANYADEFQITGMLIEENYGTKAGVFYTDYVDDVVAANLVLAYHFLRNATNEMEDMDPLLQSDYSLYLSNNISSFSHKDEALSVMAHDMMKDAVTSLPDVGPVPLINALEDRSRTKDLSDLPGGYIKGGTLTFDLTSEEVLTSRVLKTIWYNTTTDEPMELGEVAAEVIGWGMTDTATTVFLALTIAWGTGEQTVVRVDSVDMAFFDAYQEATSYNIFIIDCAMFGKDFITEMAPIIAAKSTYCYTDPLKVAKLIQALKADDVMDLAAFGTKVDTFAKYVEKVGSVRTGALGVLNRIGTVLEVIGWIIDIAMLVYGFWAIGDAFGWTPTGIGVAIAFSILTIIYTAIMFVLAALGPVGIVISLLIALSDLIVFLICGSSWSDMLIGAIVEKCIDWFADTRERSTVDLKITDTKSEIVDLDGNGLDVGDDITYQTNFTGIVNTTSYGNADDLGDSYMVPTFSVTVPDYTGSVVDTYSIPGAPSSGSNWKETPYQVGLTVTPGSGAVNLPVAISLETDYKIYYDDVWMWLFSQRKEFTGNSTSTWTTLEFDVMPGTVDDFMLWTALRPLDRDGDGLNDTAEGSNKTSGWSWDTDGDGLGDKYEIEIGTDPAAPDTDYDGMNDMLELRAGTDSHDFDSDDDGLWDNVERAGWVISFNFSGKMFYKGVNSDPCQNDTDGDGVRDTYEYYCLLNPRSKDTNGDGAADRAFGYVGASITYDRTIDLIDYLPTKAVRARVSPNGFLYVLYDNNWIEKLDSDGNYIEQAYTSMNVLNMSMDGNGHIWVCDGTSLKEYDEDLVEVRSDGQMTMNAVVDNANDIIYTIYIESMIYTYNLTTFNPIDSWSTYDDYADMRGMGVFSDGDLLMTSANSATTQDTVVRYSPDGTSQTTMGNEGTGPGQFKCPSDIALTSEDFFFVSDKDNNRVQLMDQSGVWWATFGGLGAGSDDYSFDSPISVTADDEHVYVVDYNNSRIQRLDYSFEPAKQEQNTTFTDSDGDGLTDANETKGWNVTVTSALNHTTWTYHVDSESNITDTDGDGLNDTQEFVLGTDPRSLDTDGDGLDDLTESGLGTDPCDWDTDSDGLDDATETTYGSDPKLPDTDGEGLNDWSEFSNGTDPRLNDTDGDGLEDDDEVIFGSDPNDPDSDDDLSGDKKEKDKGSDPRGTDSDGDGLTDGYEDLYGTNCTDGDSDGDGILDGAEVDMGLDPASEDTDGDGVSDGAELASGLDPRRRDSDGDGVPDSLDISSTLVLGAPIVLVKGTSDSADDFAAGLSGNATVVETTPAGLLASHKSAPYVVMVGDPDGMGAADILMKGLLNGTDGFNDARNLVCRYGVWTPTQTVVLLTEPTVRDHVKVINLLKSLRMTVGDTSVKAEYRDRFNTSQLDHYDLTRPTGSDIWVKLDHSDAFDLAVTRYNDTNTPAVLDHDGGLLAGELAGGEYLAADLGDAQDNVSGACIRFYYAEEDLVCPGPDGDVLDEATLGLYMLNATSGEWTKAAGGLDGVIATGVNTTDRTYHGKAYAGCLWAQTTRLGLFGVGGRTTTVLAPVVAVAGEDREIGLFESVLLDGGMSTGNGPIINYTWAMGNITQYGTGFEHTFTTPGTFVVNLAVKDRFGLNGTDALIVTVRDEWPLTVGPVLDTDGAALEGVLVTLSSGAVVLSNTTNATGYAHFLPGISFIDSNVSLTFSKDGYENASLNARITPLRELDRALPALKKKAVIVVPVPQDFTLAIGPVSDTDGALISGAYVNITVSGSGHQNVTDISGMTSFVLPEADLGMNISITVEKTGYKRLVHNTTITQAGTLLSPLPALEKVPAVVPPVEEEEPFPYWAVALAIVAALILIFLAVAVVLWRVRSGKKEEAASTGAASAAPPAGEQGPEGAGPEKEADASEEGDNAPQAAETGEETRTPDVATAEAPAIEYAQEVPMETAGTEDAQAPLAPPKTEEGVAAQEERGALDSLDDLDIADATTEDGQDVPADAPDMASGTETASPGPGKKGEDLSELDDLEDLEL